MQLDANERDTRSSQSDASPDDRARELDRHICDLYEHGGLSTRKIAAALGIGRRRVDRALRAARVDVAARGAGRRRPATRRPDEDDLAEQLRVLYTDLRLTRRQISQKLDITEGLVRTRLAEFDIATRTRGRVNREDRRDVPNDELIAHYRDRGLSADATGELLGVSRGVVLRAAHDYGLPVRRGAAVGRAMDPIELVNALYADALVDRTLSRHHVDKVPPGGPIWLRFPRPVTLTSVLCVDLYVDCGVSTTHIELLTGHPESAVRRLLHRAGAPMRPAGGRCPFLRRWEAHHAD